MADTVQARALQRAALILGGKDALRAALHVPMGRLDDWLAGRLTPPMDIFLKAVDIISGPGSGTAPTAAAVRARTLRQQSNELIAQTRRTVAQARVLRDIGRAEQPAPSVTRFLEAAFGPHERLTMLQAALDATIEATHANMGNVQMKRPDGLHIVAHRGFREPFLDFFNCVHDTPSACGTAAKSGDRIVVPDVAADPIFVGTPAARVMEAAGARAVQSTPLVATSGVLLGMLSTHHDHPHAPPPEELEAVDRIAARAAYWLEQVTA